MTKKIAVIFFNLGGPDSLESVKPFLFNLFNDKAITQLLQPFRFLLATLISNRRNKTAQKIYSFIGNKSPVLKNTKKQASDIETYLNVSHDFTFKTFITMRYWHPMSHETVLKVQEYHPDEIILVPLYPHWSTTTSESSVKDWEKACRKIKLKKPTKLICCYPTNEGFIKQNITLIKEEYKKAKKYGKPRVLFSAHGLPERIIKQGDPYQYQCVLTANKIVEELKIKNLDWKNTYQSQVGPLKWIGPQTDDEIILASKDNVPLIIVPIAFVSEHSETLVELDIEYKALAKQNNCPYYGRVSTVSDKPYFIKGLSNLIFKTVQQNRLITSDIEHQKCRCDLKKCALRCNIEGVHF